MQYRVDIYRYDEDTEELLYCMEEPAESLSIAEMIAANAKERGGGTSNHASRGGGRIVKLHGISLKPEEGRVYVHLLKDDGGGLCVGWDIPKLAENMKGIESKDGASRLGRCIGTAIAAAIASGMARAREDDEEEPEKD